MDYDVIIAGAGPVGLCLGLRLAREGKKVLIIEKNQTTHEHSRAPGIWCKTQEILADLGVIEKFEQQAITMDALRMYDVDNKKVILEVPIYEVRDITNYPRAMIIPQSKTEKILAEAVSQTEGAELKFSCELTGFTQDESSVSVQWIEEGELKSVSAQYLIGCDGAHSTVRKLLGFHLEGETYGMEIALADVQLKDDRTGPLISTNGVIVMAMNIDTDLWRLILPHLAKQKISLEERTQKAMQQLFPDAKYVNVWQSEFRLHNRISTQFVKGRVALAGDAAHLNSPVGGQGMNAGIQDTEVLGAAIFKALKEDNPAHLATYARLRKGAITKGVNSFTNTLTEVIFLANGKVLKWVMRVWNVLLKIPLLRKRFLRKITMLG
jgi:2-polyprenyl-6-methoxyphenol hydroxylase-like FAD-dependent oxidoreductase